MTTERLAEPNFAQAVSEEFCGDFFEFLLGFLGKIRKRAVLVFVTDFR